jgi:hypothetical protein
MNAFDLSVRIGACLEEDGLDYAIGGALALAALAIPRTTDDVDISVFAAAGDLPRVFDSFERAGVMIDRADAARSVDRIGMFTGRSGRTLVDVFVGEHPHFQAMRPRRQQRSYGSGPLSWFVSAEDLCVLKLMYGRTKDVADLERLLATHPDLDVEYVREWLQRLPGAAQKAAIFDDLVRRFRA